MFLFQYLTLSSISLVPGTPFNLAAGFLFGVTLGAPVALFGAVVGGIFSFFLGRTLVWNKPKICDLKEKDFFTLYFVGTRLGRENCETTCILPSG
jgi:uncharacterized membrane protein YdjX (TVP38/TMEM64 family)